MFRMLAWLMGAIVAISFLRGVIGIVGKLMGDQIASPRTPRPSTGTASSQGALKKCAACGTYATPFTTVERDGQKQHYCSAECASKSAAA